MPYKFSSAGGMTSKTRYINMSLASISYVTSATQVANSTTMPVPAGTQVGDMLIYIFASDTQDMLVPTGFTLGAATTAGVTGLGWAYYTVTGSVPATISGLQNLRTNEDVHAIIVLRNHNPLATPLTSSVVQTSSSTSQQSPTLSGLTASKYMIISVAALEDTPTTLTSGPSGYTVAFTAAGAGGANNSATVSAAYALVTGASSVSPGPFTFGSADVGAGVTFAITSI